jgi:putative membrane protein
MINYLEESSVVSGEARQDLAHERTDAAEERTLLARQRTFSAWMRTGLGSMALGFAIVRLLEEIQPRWVIVAISAALLLIGAAIHAFAFLSYRSTFREMQQNGESTMPLWFVGLITLALVVCAVVGVFVIVRG